MRALPYGKGLIAFERLLRAVMSNFPRGKCQIGAYAIELCFGIPMVAGDFCAQGERLWHAWNHDPRLDVHIDLTARQFDASLPRVLVTAQPQYLYAISEKSTVDLHIGPKALPETTEKHLIAAGFL